MTRTRRYLSMAALPLLAWSASATALNTTSVFSPDVRAGSQAAEYRLSFVPQSGDDAIAHRLHYQRAWSEDWRWRFIGLLSDRGADDLEYRYMRLELQNQFLSDEVGDWDAAVRYEFQIADNDDRPSRVRVAFTAKRDLDARWQIRGNFLTGREFGAESGEGYLLETRAQITRAVGDYRLGIESFNDFNDTQDVGGFDDQAHQIGPVLKGRFGGGWKFLLSGLFGVSDGADDHDIRLHLTRGF